MRFKKCAVLLLVLFCVCLCGCSALAELYEAQRSEAADYESGSIDATNPLGEKYTVEYHETGGFPSHGMTVKIYRSVFLISDYSTKFAHSNIPNQIMYLFNDRGKYYYYVAANYWYDSYYGSGKTNFFRAKIVIHDTNNNETSNITLDPTSEICVSLSKTLRKNIKRDELIKMFDKCGFNYDKIISVYDL